MTPHECRESRTCTCYMLADEPKETCPQHGSGEWPPRCAECGRFLNRLDTIMHRGDEHYAVGATP